MDKILTILMTNLPHVDKRGHFLDHLPMSTWTFINPPSFVNKYGAKNLDLSLGDVLKRLAVWAYNVTKYHGFFKNKQLGEFLFDRQERHRRTDRQIFFNLCVFRQNNILLWLTESLFINKTSKVHTTIFPKSCFSYV